MNGFPPNCMKIICFDSKCCPWMLIRMINLWTDDERQMIKQTSKSMTIYSRSSLVNWPFQIESHSENCIFHKRIWFMRSKWNEFASLIFAWTARILFTLFFPWSQCDCEQFYPSDEIYFLQIHIAVVVFRRWRSQFIRWNSINLATDRCFQFNLSFDCFFFSSPFDGSSGMWPEYNLIASQSRARQASELLTSIPTMALQPIKMCIFSLSKYKKYRSGFSKYSMSTLKYPKGASCTLWNNIFFLFSWKTFGLAFFCAKHTNICEHRKKM